MKRAAASKTTSTLFRFFRYRKHTAVPTARRSTLLNRKIAATPEAKPMQGRANLAPSSAATSEQRNNTVTQAASASDCSSVTPKAKVGMASANEHARTPASIPKSRLARSKQREAMSIAANNWKHRAAKNQSNPN